MLPAVKPLITPQLLNAEQDQCRPDVIEKLNGDEQNPERDFVPLRFGCESNAVMADKHFQ
jgi:hypothetical protein